METDLIDRIYECSVVPELWPGVLDDLAQSVDARGGLLFSVRKTLAFTASDTVRDVFTEYVRDGWFARCSRRVCLMSRSEPSFFVEQDFWTMDEIDADPIYRDFFRPRGLGWSAGTGLQVPTGDNIVFSMERAFDRGPVERDYVARLNELRPHIARSAFVSARLNHKRAQGGSEALAALSLPALVIDDSGHVAQTNEGIAAHDDLFRWGARDRLGFVDRQANELLETALEAMQAGASDQVRSFPVRDAGGTPMMVAHLLPVARTAHDIFGPGFAVLLLTPLRREKGPSPALLRQLFDLTPSEARVASGLAKGASLESIAQDGDVAITTVRSQLRRVLEKTGCTRQADVAALLANIAATGPDASDEGGAA